MYEYPHVVILSGIAGSGKTEFALQYAQVLAKTGKTVHIVDLDVINVYFRSRENKENLNAQGIQVWGASDFSFNGIDLPAVSFGFESLLAKKDTYVIIDLAGTQNGLKLLMSLQNKSFPYAMWMVCNVYREESDSVVKIVDLVRSYEAFSSFHFTGLVNNSNFLETTTYADLHCGQVIIEEAADILHLPIPYIMADETLSPLPWSVEQPTQILYMSSLYNRKTWMKGETI